MIAIGLTGGIATGKSTVGEILRRKGIEVVSADELVHQALLPGGGSYHSVVKEFGREILLPDGKINRKLLGEIVFKDDAARRRLEQLTHPVVIEAIKQRLESGARAGNKIIVVETPLLFEVGLCDLFDYIWVVSSTRERQLERICKRDRLTEEEAERRIAAQLPLEEKERKADAVIYNNNGLEALEKQVVDLLKTLE
ncbi:MAG: dephospho-CoA kinase [Firmicutes bacterium]|nr:dephospho-CoA kinase [Bacillota bacterium]